MLYHILYSGRFRTNLAWIVSTGKTYPQFNDWFPWCGKHWALSINGSCHHVALCQISHLLTYFYSIICTTPDFIRICLKLYGQQTQPNSSNEWCPWCDRGQPRLLMVKRFTYVSTLPTNGSCHFVAFSLISLLFIWFYAMTWKNAWFRMN